MTSEPVTLRERPSGRMVDDFLPSLIVAGGHGLVRRVRRAHRTAQRGRDH